MIYIQNGREKFYQWDLNQHLVVVNENITQLHFTNALTAEALITEVVDGVAAVPNILLQSDWDISVYGTCGECVREIAKFKIEPRVKPSDYAYTETEVKNYKALEDRVAALEEGGGAGVDLSDYYTKEEVDERLQGGSLSTWKWASVDGLTFRLVDNTRHIRIVCYIPKTSTMSNGALAGEDYIHTLDISCGNDEGFYSDESFYLHDFVNATYTISPILIYNNKGDISFYGNEYGATYPSPHYRKPLTANDITILGYYYWGGTETITEEDLYNYYTKEEVDELIPDVSNFATKDEIPEAQDLSAYALKSEIPTVKAATSSAIGMVKPDNSTITIDGNGTISAITSGGGGGSGAGWKFACTPYSNSFYLEQYQQTNMIKLLLYMDDTYQTVIDVAIGGECFEYFEHWFYPFLNGSEIHVSCDRSGEFTVECSGMSIQVNQVWYWG